MNTPVANITDRGLGEINLTLTGYQLKSIVNGLQQSEVAPTEHPDPQDYLAVVAMIIAYLEESGINIEDLEDNQTITLADSVAVTSGIIKNDQDRDPQDIARFLSLLNEDYLTKLIELKEMMPSMHKSCEISLCIPMAAHEEKNNILRTLKSLTRQSIDNEKFEIVILANHPKASIDGKSITEDGSVNLLKSFANANPDLNISFLYVTFEGKEATIGHIRSFVTDLALLRHLDRNSGEDHILVSLDSDLHGIHKNWLKNFLEKFNKHPEYDSFGGRLAWSAQDCDKNPLLLLNAIFDRIVNHIFYIEDKGCGGPGTNFAFRASAYCLAGGYNPETKLGEDVELRHRLETIRAGSEKYQAVGNGGKQSYCYTSGRRALAAIETGHPLCEQWSQMTFSTEDSRIRQGESFVNQTFEDILYSPSFFRQAETLMNRTFARNQYWSGKTINVQHVERILEFFDCNFIFTGSNSIQILEDNERFRERLQELRIQNAKSFSNYTGFTIKDLA